MAFTVTNAAEVMNEALTAYFGEGSYQIDTSSTATIQEGFNKIGAYPPEMKNALLNQVNVIWVYRNYGTMFDESKNQTRVFWRNAIDYGGGEADIYQQILEPIENLQEGVDIPYAQGTWAADYAGLSKEESKALALQNAAYHFNFHNGAVAKKFHTDSARKDFAISVSELEISKIFTPEGFAGYLSVKLANLQWSAEVYLQNAVIAAIKNMVSDGGIVFDGNHNINTMAGVTEMVETIKTHTESMLNVNTLYNNAGIITISDRDDLFLVSTPEFLTRLETRGAENAYNLNEYRIRNRIITLPNGSDLGTHDGESVMAILLDRRAIVMAMRYWKMAPFVPTGTDWQNYFLKLEHIYGYNEFFNAVAYTCAPIDGFVDEDTTYLNISGSSIAAFDIETDGVTELKDDTENMLVIGASYVHISSMNAPGTTITVNVDGLTMQPYSFTSSTIDFTLPIRGTVAIKLA